jgi:pimeloyl-ACP methyl ester carboxylesterase
MPAQSPTPAPDPVVHMAGGPGNDAILFSPTIIKAGLNRNRDMIFMSARGTYSSDPSLTCPEVDQFEEARIGMAYDAPATGQANIEAVRQCRARLLTKYPGIDFSSYNTREAAADYDALREALGLKEWNLFGHSYGTNLALQSMRLYPKGIRTVVLDGVAPPSEVSVVAWPWGSMKESNDAIFRACADQPACAARFPGLPQKYTDLVNKLEANPLRTTVKLSSGQSKNVVLDGGALVTWMILGAHQSTIVPLWLEELANGKPEKIATQYAERFVQTPQTLGTFAWGFHDGVACSEWVPFKSAAEEMEAARRAFPNFPASVLAQGPQLPFLREACEVWPVEKAPASVRDATRSDIRTLIMNGTFDAQTGAQWGDIAASTLSNVTNVKFPGLSHGPFVNPCGATVITSFWNTPNAPDTSCVSQVTIRPFDLG